MSLLMSRGLDWVTFEGLFQPGTHLLWDKDLQVLEMDSVLPQLFFPSEEMTFLSVSVTPPDLGKQSNSSCGFNKNKRLSNSSQVDFNEERAGPPLHLGARVCFPNRPGSFSSSLLALLLSAGTSSSGFSSSKEASSHFSLQQRSLPFHLHWGVFVATDMLK